MSMIGSFVYAADEEIRRLHSTPEGIVPFLEHLEEAVDERSLEIEKTWHAFHWLLTGTEYEGEPPLNFIVSGGAEIGDVDAGYGPARSFTSDKVRGIDQALASISTADLLARYDARAMSDLYPGIWDRADEREIILEDLTFHFDRLKGFIARASEQGMGMIAYLT